MTDWICIAIRRLEQGSNGKNSKSQSLDYTGEYRTWICCGECDHTSLLDHGEVVIRLALTLPSSPESSHSALPKLISDPVD